MSAGLVTPDRRPNRRPARRRRGRGCRPVRRRCRRLRRCHRRGPSGHFSHFRKSQPSENFGESQAPGPSGRNPCPAGCGQTRGRCDGQQHIRRARPALRGSSFIPP
ncbi:MAG: hypothetical protein DWI27_02275 [Planctomycetota bacterium]|nr:MAG: hypothetical protein DWI27_02275 [Planctomycetota bacterium]